MPRTIFAEHHLITQNFWATSGRGADHLAAGKFEPKSTKLYLYSEISLISHQIGPYWSNSKSFEITMQLVVIMVVKPIFINILLYLLPIIMVAFNKKEARKTLQSKQKTRWEEDYKLLPESEVSYDYVQMVIQGRFLTKAAKF